MAPGATTRPPVTGAIFITVPSIVMEWISTWSAPVTEAPSSVSGVVPVLVTLR